MDFTEEQIERYSRHIILPEIGGRGQARLLKSKVFVLGAGGLGSPSLLYLAAAGVGTIGVADGDSVDLSNLQRQIIHDTSRIGMPKVLSAKASIEAINPDVKVEPLHGR
ncbi:MAG: HesA/MoeB/ThiF family protein, partial [Deltaproteobacteria bacterium]